MRSRSRNRAGTLGVVRSIALGGCRSASPVSETVDSAAGSKSISLEQGSRRTPLRPTRLLLLWLVSGSAKQLARSWPGRGMPEWIGRCPTTPSPTVSFPVEKCRRGRRRGQPV